MLKNQKGFSHVLIFVVIIILAAVGFAGWRVMNADKDDKKQQNNTSADQGTSSGAEVSWSFNGETWQSSGTPPACPDPLLQPFTDFSKATTVLYPGQTRGGNYKPHGGLRFDQSTNEIIVTAPIDAAVYRGSRYIEANEHQFMFDFINSCGIMFRLDHLLELSPKLQDLADKLPPAKENDSRTTPISGASVKAGEEIATAVGFPQTNNVTFDFGLYDLRQPNEASKGSAYAADHSSAKETAYYAVCWLDNFGSATSLQLKALPGGDQSAGKTSDYCK